MKAKRAYRDRETVEVAVLDALVERGEEGMTVLELRSSVDADIDAIETALAELKQDDLITVVDSDTAAVIKPDDRVVPDPGEEPREPTFLEKLRERLPF